MRLHIAWAVFTCCAAGFAQTAANTVTVTASRSSTTQQDQVVFRVAVDAPLDTTRDDAVGLLQGTGITAANLQGVSTVQQYDQHGMTATTLIEWVFALPAAIADMKSTIGVLSAVQASNAKKNNGTSISFAVQGTQYSAQAIQAQQCAAADLLSDARAQAQKLASAAGKTVGSVLAISGASQATATTGVISSATYQPSCTMTVKFQLAGF